MNKQNSPRAFFVRNNQHVTTLGTSTGPRWTLQELLFFHPCWPTCYLVCSLAWAFVTLQSGQVTNTFTSSLRRDDRWSHTWILSSSQKEHEVQPIVCSIMLYLLHFFYISVLSLTALWKDAKRMPKGVTSSNRIALKADDESSWIFYCYHSIYLICNLYFVDMDPRGRTNFYCLMALIIYISMFLTITILVPFILTRMEDDQWYQSGIV